MGMIKSQRTYMGYQGVTVRNPPGGAADDHQLVPFPCVAQESLRGPGATVVDPPLRTHLVVMPMTLNLCPAEDVSPRMVTCAVCTGEGPGAWVRQIDSLLSPVCM